MKTSTTAVYDPAEQRASSSRPYTTTDYSSDSVISAKTRLRAQHTKSLRFCA